jgi:hypothetical protein
MLVAFVILCAVGTRVSLADELSRAKNSIEEGDLSRADEIYAGLYERFNDNSTVQLRFMDFLISTNQFDKLVEKFGDSKLPGVRERLEKAKQYLGTILSGNIRSIAKLVDECGNSSEVLRACIQVNLMDENYPVAERFLQRALSLFPKKETFLKMKAQLLALNKMYPEAARLLNSVGEGELAEILDKISRRKMHIQATADAASRFHQTMDLLSVVSKHVLGDDFSPSIFTMLQFDLLFELCQLGVRLKATGLTSRCASLVKKRRTDETMYLYIMSLINDGHVDRVKEELASYEFSNSAYKNAITRRIDQLMKEQEERERQSRQRQYRQGHQQHSQHAGPKRGTDFLGYYSALKVGASTRPEEIKRAYKRAVVAGKKKKKATKKEEEAWNAEFCKLNKAKDILLDTEKRRLYDSGVDPDNPQPQFEHGGFGRTHPFENFFSGFQDFGFGNSRESRHGRTYYYYYG